MKTIYNCSFEMWKEFQPGGHLDAEPTGVQGIWKVTEHVSGDYGFVFVDETENFYPHIYKTVDEALEGRAYYGRTELG